MNKLINSGKNDINHGKWHFHHNICGLDGKIIDSLFRKEFTIQAGIDDFEKFHEVNCCEENGIVRYIGVLFERGSCLSRQEHDEATENGCY